ncbi:MAG: 1-deoxy-D-xylulose-5-phosphate reductoisomerase [Acholeplasmatales bacterium]|nr:1-deoxy-D-xylulose-5-phosphate reductoisomerase [Acholeplasmatales bacterium]
MNIILLGGTGSIGTLSLELIDEFNYNLLGVSLGTDTCKSLEIVKKFKPEYICVRKEEDKAIFKDYVKNIFVGNTGLDELASIKCDILINALSGSVGLKPTISALKAKNDIALANKESLVMAGDIVMDLARKENVKIYPVDSEHSAIWQCLNGEDNKTIKKLYITASGGAFRDKKREELVDVTVTDALNHPNWKMGKKITIDSATMMNKGFEVIEAHHLFGVSYENIKPIMHKESIVHSLVLFNDSNMKALLAPISMKEPILYALNKGSRVKYDNGFNLTTLHFKNISFKRFPCLKYAIEAGKKGGIMPTVLQAANEAAVELFLNGKIKFLDIEEIVYQELKKTKNFKPSLEDIIRVNEEVKNRVIGGRL